MQKTLNKSTLVQIATSTLLFLFLVCLSIFRRLNNAEPFHATPSATSKTHRVLTTADASTLTAHIDHSTGTYRHFRSNFCKSEHTLQDLFPVFFAHSVEWNQMGRDDPWWSVLSNFPQGTEISSQDKDRFYDSGRDNISKVMHDLNLSRVGNVLDFGCGLGRLAMSFVPYSNRVVCVDQSTFHLERAKEEWLLRRGDAIAEIEFVTSSPDLIAAVQGERFDLVHTDLTLQHMVPQLQQVYLEQFCDVLKEDGVGWIQIPTKTRATTCELERSMKDGGLQMHGTPLHDLKHILMRRGCVADVIRDEGVGPYNAVVLKIWRTVPSLH